MRRVILLAVGAVALTVGFAPAAHASHYNHLLAPKSACAKQRNVAAPANAQERAMRCMHRYARKKAGVPALEKSGKLQRSSDGKARDILGCLDFSHTACGRDPFYWLRKTSYLLGCFGAAENISYGAGSQGSVRSTMRRWLNSDGHRLNLLRSRFRQIGASMVEGRWLGGNHVQIWVTHFGYRC